MTTDNSSPSQALPADVSAQVDADVAGQDNQPESSNPDSQEAPQEAVLQTEVARLKEQLLRMAADFDNFRKRSRREIADAERMAREDLLRELLPVFDNLERASTHVGAATDVQSLADGIRMVGKQFTDTLARLGVERVSTIGEAFDPSVHEAIQHLETQEYPPGCVAAEVLGGYKFGERLIRPAMVVVAKAPANDKPSD